MLTGALQQYISSRYIGILWNERMARAISDKYLAHNHFYTM